MIDRIDKLVAAGKTFAFETTCAGYRQAKLLRTCRAAGYRVILIFLWLPSAQAAIARVAQRVARGGHQIPEDTIARRYGRCLQHAARIPATCGCGLIYDNSGTSPLLIAEKRSNLPFVIRDAARWKLIEDVT
jgi:predicted ABC-type ATPase